MTVGNGKGDSTQKMDVHTLLLMGNAVHRMPSSSNYIRAKKRKAVWLGISVITLSVVILTILFGVITKII